MAFAIESCVRTFVTTQRPKYMEAHMSSDSMCMESSLACFMRVIKAERILSLLVH